MRESRALAVDQFLVSDANRAAAYRSAEDAPGREDGAMIDCACAVCPCDCRMRAISSFTQTFDG
ncbi:hypothetical protein D3C80_1881620 [compost metagenome]